MLNIGGKNLTQINFSNITGEIKSIDSLKYYQKSLAELALILTDEEKISIEKLIEHFFNQHYYFSKVWPHLNSKKKRKKFGYCIRGKTSHTFWASY